MSSHMLLVLLVAGIAVAYALACVAWPFTSCRWCKGGKWRSPLGGSWRLCGVCGGSNSRVRWGRRLVGWAAPRVASRWGRSGDSR